MLSFIREEASCWESLQGERRPLVLYGMGNGAEKILGCCASYGLQPAALFASDEFVRGQSFRGFTVQKYSDVVKAYGDEIVILLAFGSERPEVVQRVRELAAKHTVLAPHLPLFAEDEPFDRQWLDRYAAQLAEVYARLADERSQAVFAAALNYRLSGKINYLLDCASERRGDLRELFHFGSEEVYLDLGAYDGDTVCEFLELTGGACRSILAVEPDARNYRKLCACLATLAPGKAAARQVAVWSAAGRHSFCASGGRQASLLLPGKEQLPVECIDNLVGTEPVTYIKMDVEGAEVAAVQGGRRTIGRWHPHMLLAAYHYNADLFRLPLLLWELVPHYKIYLRKHPCLPCWELNYFCTL